MSDAYYASYQSLNDDIFSEDELDISGSSLADAAAKMLIHLIENKHMGLP